MRRDFYLATGVLLLLAAAMTAPRAGAGSREAPRDEPRAGGGSGAEDARLARLFDEFLEAEFRRSPTFATELGDHRFDTQIDDLSAPALAAREAEEAAFLERLGKELHPADLSPAGRADLEVLRNHIEGSIFTFRKLRPHERDPLTYSSLIGGSIYGLLKRDFAPLDERVRSAIARMAKVPEIARAARANLKDPSRPPTEVAIRQNHGAVDFYDRELAAYVKGSSLADEAVAAGKRTAAALREYGEWLEKDLLPRTTADWRLGRALWEEKLRYSLDSSLSAAEVLDRARGEFDRVRGEMLEVSRGLWPSLFPGEAPPTGPDALGKTVRAVVERVSREHSTREGIVADARAVIDELKGFIREKDLLRLPEPDRCNIIEMPEFQAGVSVAYLDPAPPLEPAGKSFYAIERIPSSWSDAEAESRLREYNRWMLRILSIHEGYPGHYVQLEESNRFPSKVRRVLGNGPMVEGWAVYTERMMTEAGLLGGDPRLRLNQLKFYLRAVTNALIDQGLHAGGMSEEEALRLMTQDAFQESNEAKGKLVRAQVTSTQLSTYFVGFQEIWKLRQEVERAEGTSFSLRRFHERFLSQGSPPVRVIRSDAFGLK